MRVLVLAPHPFYQERGTPIAVNLLLRVLSERGDQVDILTYHEGTDVVHPGLTIHRIHPIPLVNDIRPGFSWKKLVCDAAMLGKLLSLMLRNRYDVVHAMEESAFLAQWLCGPRGIPYIYDMDSSLSGQIMDRYPAARTLRPFFELMERRLVRSARAVVPMCDALADVARSQGARSIHVLRDVSLVDANGSRGMDLRREYAIAGKLVMYIGNLEAYQGIDLLLRSFARIRAKGTEVTLVVIGGVQHDIAHYRRLAGQLGIGNRVIFTGPKSVANLGSFMRQADVLVSPRIRGTNTPMKVYSYLDSGVAVLATDLPTHTQVMDEATACLAAPDPDSFARALGDLLADDALRARLAAAARELIRTAHSYPVFRDQVNVLYDELEREAGLRSAAPPPSRRGSAGPP